MFTSFSTGATTVGVSIRVLGVDSAVDAFDPTNQSSAPVNTRVLDTNPKNSLNFIERASRCLNVFTFNTAVDINLKRVSDATLVVSSDQLGRRRTNKERPRDEPAVRIIAVFLDESVAALREAFGDEEQQRSVRRQAAAAICYGSSSIASGTGYQGDMRGEGVRRMQTGLSNGNKHPLHTYAHKKGSG